jgi:hypothetical protein
VRFFHSLTLAEIAGQTQESNAILSLKNSMGDWRTLHFFDKTKYINEVVPKVRNIETYLTDFLNEDRTRRLNRFLVPKEEIIKQTKELVSELDEELNYHPILIELNKVKNKKYENYTVHRDVFIRNNQPAIEFFEFLIIETIFANVADYNPHFLLGKRAFEGSIETENNSISYELLEKIRFQDQCSILDLIDGGIINWLSAEEVQMLHMDEHKIKPSNTESLDYVNEFKEFLKYASEKNLGLISLRNPKESDLINLRDDDSNRIEFTKKTTFNYIIV